MGIYQTKASGRRRSSLAGCSASYSFLGTSSVIAIAFSSAPALALQLHIWVFSESMGRHDSEIMDDGRIDRGDDGALGLVVDVKARMRPLFTQERVAASAGLFLDGLLGDEPRKTGFDPLQRRSRRHALARGPGTREQGFNLAQLLAHWVSGEIAISLMDSNLPSATSAGARVNPPKHAIHSNRMIASRARRKQPCSPRNAYEQVAPLSQRHAIRQLVRRILDPNTQQQQLVGPDLRGQCGDADGGQGIAIPVGDGRGRAANAKVAFLVVNSELTRAHLIKAIEQRQDAGSR
jgi:hypothetical protein